MRLGNLDLNLIVALEALIRLGSVTAAADELNVTQSAMSSALNRARQHFADEILFYNGQKMVPTPFGLELDAVVPGVISQLRTLARMRARSDLKGIQRQFSVIATDYVTVVYLSEVSKRLTNEAPGISLSVVPFTGEAISGFKRSEIDFLIGPEFILDDGCHIEPLFSESFQCVLWQGNSYSKSGFTRKAYLESPHVLTNFFIANGKSHFERWLDTEGFTVKVAAALPSFLVLPYYIAGTNNVATIHKRLVPQFQSMTDLAFVDAPFKIPLLHEMLATRKDRRHDTEAELLKQFMLEVSNDLHV